MLHQLRISVFLVQAYRVPSRNVFDLPSAPDELPCSQLKDRLPPHQSMVDLFSDSGCNLSVKPTEHHSVTVLYQLQAKSDSISAFQGMVLIISGVDDRSPAEPPADLGHLPLFLCLSVETHRMSVVNALRFCPCHFLPAALIMRFVSPGVSHCLQIQPK